MVGGHDYRAVAFCQLLKRLIEPRMLKPRSSKRPVCSFVRRNFFQHGRIGPAVSQDINKVDHYSTQVRLKEVMDVLLKLPPICRIGRAQ
jgi:hypothetical protein